MLQLILVRLDRFPAERLVRMESDLKNLKALLEDEISSRKKLNAELGDLSKNIQTMIEQRVDRALSDCRQDRDLRIGHLAERIDGIQGQDQEQRTMNLRMKIAILGAISAFVISIFNAFVGLLSHN